MDSIRKSIQEDRNWASRARLIEIFHSSLMIKRKEWSIRKTAKALKMCASTVCEDIQLAKFMIDDPSIEKFVKRKDALRYIHD